MNGKSNVIFASGTTRMKFYAAIGSHGKASPFITSVCFHLVIFHKEVGWIQEVI